MLSNFAKFLLVATSLSPLLGAVAVSQFARGEPALSWASWLVAAALLVFLCWAVLRYAATNAQHEVYHIREFQRDDKEVIAFLIAYLLPFLSSEKMGFTGNWLTGAYVLLIIFLVIVHAGAFHFNPVMGLLGYYFYAVKNSEGVSHLLISKEELRRTGTEVPVVRLAHGIYLQRARSDA